MSHFPHLKHQSNPVNIIIYNSQHNSRMGAPLENATVVLEIGYCGSVGFNLLIQRCHGTAQKAHQTINHVILMMALTVAPSCFQRCLSNRGSCKKIISLSPTVPALPDVACAVNMRHSKQPSAITRRLPQFERLDSHCSYTLHAAAHIATLLFELLGREAVGKCVLF